MFTRNLLPCFAPSLANALPNNRKRRINTLPRSGTGQGEWGLFKKILVEALFSFRLCR